MARLNEVFSFQADTNGTTQSAEQFFTERGIDYTLSRSGRFGILDSVSIGKPVMREAEEPNGYTRVEVGAYNEDTKTISIIKYKTDGSTETEEVDVYPPEPVVQPAAPAEATTDFGIPRKTPQEYDAMDTHDFNSNILNEFIEFVKPYNLNGAAQGALIEAIDKCLTDLGEVRYGKELSTDAPFTVRSSAPAEEIPVDVTRKETSPT